MPVPVFDLTGAVVVIPSAAKALRAKWRPGLRFQSQRCDRCEKFRCCWLVDFWVEELLDRAKVHCMFECHSCGGVFEVVHHSRLRVKGVADAS